MTFIGPWRSMVRERYFAGVLSSRLQQRRSMSLWGTLFGIGEFEAPREQSLARKTNKNQAYDLALLEVDFIV